MTNGSYVCSLLPCLPQDAFDGDCREVALAEKEREGEGWVRFGKVCWRMVYDGSQKVFQLFDNTRDYKLVEKVRGS